jgi:hypothetical protein
VLKPESWAVLALAAFGIIAAVFAFARTPREQRFRVRRRSVEEMLADSPPAARAVIIRADRRRALLRDLPWLLALLPLAFFALWIQVTHGDDCAALFGVGRPRLLLAGFFFVAPLLALAVSLLTAGQAISALRSGYWPPLDTPQYRDTLATAGPLVRLRAVAMLALLPLLLALLAYGYAQLGREGSIGKLIEQVVKSEAGCVARR